MFYYHVITKGSVNDYQVSVWKGVYSTIVLLDKWGEGFSHRHIVLGRNDVLPTGTEQHLNTAAVYPNSTGTIKIERIEEDYANNLAHYIGNALCCPFDAETCSFDFDNSVPLTAPSTPIYNNNPPSPTVWEMAEHSDIEEIEPHMLNFDSDSGYGSGEDDDF
jgi:hypothetical protein